MAKENIKKFFEEVSKNADLQKQLKAATEKSEAEIAKAVKAQVQAVVEVAKKAGFVFSADELLSAGAPEGAKLDMNELDAVAGGGIKGFCLIIGGGRGSGTVCYSGKSRGGICEYIGVGWGFWGGK